MPQSFNYPFRIDNRDDYNEILKDLNEKIDLIKKRVSYFDFYNITNAVTDSNNFAAQINSLPFNEALVINTPPFYYSGENYSTGDVVIKNNIGGLHHIKAQTGGVYYPQKIEKHETGEYSFSYAYADSMPTVSSDTVNIKNTTEATANFAEKIIFTGVQANNAAESNIYGIGDFLLESGSYAFEIQKDANDNDIWPFIQFFLCQDRFPQEHIILDYTLTKEDGDSTRYWRVTPTLDGMDYSLIYIKVK